MTTMLNHPRYQQLRAHGYTVTAAFWGVRRHEHFMKTLRADLAKHKKAARAAKKGWKTRRANQKGL